MFKIVLQDPPNNASTRTKAGWLSAFDGIHTTGFSGLLAFIRQCPLLPVKPAVETVEKVPFQKLTFEK